MTGHRKSYQRTLLAAAFVAVMAVAVGVASLVLAALVSFPLFVAGTFAALCFALACAAAWTAAGGLIALKRDTLETRGQAYYSTKPRERQPGFFTQLRRSVLGAISGSPSRLRLWPGEWVQIRPY